MKGEDIKSKIAALINPEKGDEIRQGIQRFKMDLLKYLPFYGDILMRVEIIEDKWVPSAQTNGKDIRYNPAFMGRLREGERNFVILHEVFHIMLFHWKRPGDRDPRIWNVACDYVVNAMLTRLGWNISNHDIRFEKPQEGCFLSRQYWGESVENLYANLIKENSKGKRILTLGGKPVGRFQEDLVCSEDMTDAECLEAEIQIKQLLAETVKRRGLGPGYFLPREITSLVETKRLPWNKLLYQFMQEREDEENSYLTPERKYIHMDLIIPGISKSEDELGEIWAFIDSSGSIADKELAQFMTQLYRIAGEFHCMFNIAYWDTEVTDIYRRVKDRNKILKCNPKHSGGTDINCVYRYIREQKIRPEVLLILTDGYFGEVAENIGNLPKKTILVISENGREMSKNNGIGTLAKL